DGLLDVTEIGERADGERPIADPVVPIVPVADPADDFGKRRGGCGGNTTRPLIGEEFEREFRTHHGVVVISVEGAVLAVTRVCPLAPELYRVVQQALAGVRIERGSGSVAEYEPAGVVLGKRVGRVS